jgi:hypothetical protein
VTVAFLADNRAKLEIVTEEDVIFNETYVDKTDDTLANVEEPPPPVIKANVKFERDIPSGVFWIASEKPIKYSVVSGSCRIYVKGGKDPWPTPPPPPPRLWAVSTHAWETFNDAVGPTTTTKDRFVFTIQAERVATAKSAKSAKSATRKKR